MYEMKFISVNYPPKPGGGGGGAGGVEPW